MLTKKGTKRSIGVFDLIEIFYSIFLSIQYTTHIHKSWRATKGSNWDFWPYDGNNRYLLVDHSPRYHSLGTCSRWTNTLIPYPDAVMNMILFEVFLRISTWFLNDIISRCLFKTHRKCLNVHAHLSIRELCTCFPF